MGYDFYKGKKVFITGHTGFKGTWICKMLLSMGAEVSGYSLTPPTAPALFDICGAQKDMLSVIGDIRDRKLLCSTMQRIKPDIVIHMAAQPIVRESYKNPVYTYETNVMGTVNLLEAVRSCDSVRSVVNVTTDKVYLNREWQWGYRENEELNGSDPYSNSKSCSELVTSCYKKSFFNERGTAVSSCRAGNVIGGGDFAPDRIIPDCIRAAHKGEDIIVRNPHSTRPYQHVLEPLTAYLTVAQKQYEDPSLADSYNVGPEERDCRTTGELVTLFCESWNRLHGTDIKWNHLSDGGPHEANFLKLDCSKIKAVIGWRPRLSIEEALDKTVEWSNAYYSGENVSECMERQIGEFIF